MSRKQAAGNTGSNNFMARLLTLRLPRFPRPVHTPTPPALRLGDHTLTHAQLRQGLVLLGPEARTTHAEFRLPVQAHDLPTTFFTDPERPRLLHLTGGMIP